MAKYCTNCGAQNPDANLRCTNCGQVLSTSQPVGTGTGAGSASTSGSGSGGYSSGGYQNVPYGNRSLDSDETALSNYLSFRTMVTPMVIKLLYVLGALGITIGGVILLIASGSSHTCDAFGNCSSNGDTYVLAGILLIIFGNLYWRIICEMAIIFFSIHDRLKGIESEVGKK